MVFVPVLPAAFAGYLAGSLPTAYLLVRSQRRLDIRRSGSGNVGALNTYEVTGSRALGATVLVTDLLKGMAAVWIGLLFHPAGGAVAAAGAVLGHCYPVWLGFHGGRGLATAAGAVLLLAWPFVPVWGLAWLAAFACVREVNIGNLIATATAGGVAAAAPLFTEGFALAGPPPPDVLRICMLVLLGIILSRLVEPVARVIRARMADREEGGGGGRT